VLDRYLPSLPDLFDPTPLVWIVGAFTVYVLLLLPFALLKGEVGKNARAILKDLFALFHALLDIFKGRGGSA
jgi:hypothetical protein